MACVLPRSDAGLLPYLKKIPLLDVLTLSGLYTLRLLAGSAASGAHISHWLGGFSIFLFFSLAIVKRFAELEEPARQRYLAEKRARLPG